MSETLDKIRDLVSRGEVRLSVHGYEELAADGISARDTVRGITDAELLEDYPDYSKGPCVLVLQRDSNAQPIHVVWGIPAGESSPAVVVTGYRPDPELWDQTFRRRLK